MTWNSHLLRYLARLIVEEWKKVDTVQWKVDPEKAAAKIQAVLNEDLQKEKELDQEVHRMMEELEKTHSNQFERYKMYPLLKKKLAEKKGIIL